MQFQPDEDLYYRICAELFLYLRQYQPPHPWRVVMIYPRRSVERKVANQFKDLLNLDRVSCIYLNELEETEESPLGVSLMKLIIAKEVETGEKARQLLQQTQAQVQASPWQQDIIDLIESIVVYKFPEMSREEVARMLGVEDLKQTRFYQEVFAEGRQEEKLQVLSRMLESGVDHETIAQWLDLPLETVRKQANFSKLPFKDIGNYYKS